MHKLLYIPDHLCNEALSNFPKKPSNDQLGFSSSTLVSLEKEIFEKENKNKIINK